MVKDMNWYYWAHYVGMSGRRSSYNPEKSGLFDVFSSQSLNLTDVVFWLWFRSTLRAVAEETPKSAFGFGMQRPEC